MVASGFANNLWRTVPNGRHITYYLWKNTTKLNYMVSSETPLLHRCDRYGWYFNIEYRLRKVTGYFIAKSSGTSGISRSTITRRLSLSTHLYSTREVMNNN